MNSKFYLENQLPNPTQTNFKKFPYKQEIIKFEEPKTLILKNLSILLILIFALSSCKSKNNPPEVTENEPDAEKIEITQEAIDDIINYISSPIEMAAFANDLGIPFDKSNLLDLEKIKDYSLNYEKAYALGMLYADLGYVIEYEKTSISTEHLSLINQFAGALGMADYFDFNTLNDLAGHNSGLDSMTFYSIRSFNEINRQLRESGKKDFSALLITGVWIEGMYQLTNIRKNDISSDLTEYIGEQKMILNYIILILESYKKEEKFQSLIQDYMKLKEFFDLIKITYELGEPDVIEQDGMIVVVQQERSKVEMDPEALESIIGVIEEIRNKHLGW
jgi:hypothetical protein